MADLPGTNIPPWWIEGTPGWYRVRLEHPQFGVRLEFLQASTLADAESAGNSLYEGWRAVWTHRQPYPRGAFGEAFSGNRD